MFFSRLKSRDECQRLNEYVLENPSPEHSKTAESGTVFVMNNASVNETVSYNAFGCDNFF